MLVFLDIDGVMVPAKGWKSPELLEDGFPAFSSTAIHTLQRLASEDLTIMLTTSHKANFSIQEWKEIFEHRGIPVQNLLSLPENIKNLNRRDEIMQWFTDHPGKEAFVIIDDDRSLNDLPTHIKEHLILTSPTIGLTEDHLNAIESILFRNV